ncbi:hypothetical protein CUZ91_2905 [Enterococcus xinjiangensis]|nr:hypothetical protein [Enterococcus lactis]
MLVTNGFPVRKFFSTVKRNRFKEVFREARKPLIKGSFNI